VKKLNVTPQGVGGIVGGGIQVGALRRRVLAKVHAVNATPQHMLRE